MRTSAAISRDVLTKIYDLCKARGILFERSVNLPEQNSTVLDYGPLGTEIKRNLHSEWWREIVTSRENVYGLDLALPNICDQAIQHEAGITAQSTYLSSYLAHTYHYAWRLIKDQGKGDLSIGLAQSLSMVRNGNSHIDKFMFSSKRKEFYKLCFFCPPNKVNYWMDYWTRKRLSWWKKYADIPAGFSLTDEDCREHFYQNCDEDLSDTTAVQFNFPWGKEAIESISSYTDVRTLIDNDTGQGEYLGVVVASLSVERGILAYLLDAYHESDYPDSKGIKNTRSKLRLHPALAPVKVAVFSKNASNTDLGRVARQLATELRQEGINCQYQEVGNSSGDDSHENYTWQQDEIGTPHAVTLEDTTLVNGVVTLRNRDTTLSEFLHLSEILKTVQRHLDSF